MEPFGQTLESGETDVWLRWQHKSVASETLVRKNHHNTGEALSDDVRQTLGSVVEAGGFPCQERHGRE